MRNHFSFEIPFMKYRKVLLTISAVMTVLAVVGLLVRGLTFGIEFQGGTEIDFGGNSYSVKNLAGATSLVDCPAFTVDGQWTISADDAIAGHPLETAGSIAFGAGSSVAFAQPSEPVINERTYTVLTAASGVTGFVPGTVAKNWRTSLSGDGKSVLLTHVGPGFILTFK